MAYMPLKMHFMRYYSVIIIIVVVVEVVELVVVSIFYSTFIDDL